MRKGTCKHFNGLGLGDRKGAERRCNAGVCYRNHVGGPDFGWGARIPCITDSTLGRPDQRIPCRKYEEPTDEEVATFDAQIQKDIERVVKVEPLIATMKTEFKDRDGEKTVACPICGGNLRMTHSSYNGHVHGVCDTKNCIAWME